jgi:hypothetical protein
MSERVVGRPAAARTSATGGTSPAPADAHAVELRREASTMALYVTVCLLAALSAIAEQADAGHVDVFTVIWGTTIGLAVAHWFAFRVSARLVGAGRIGRHDAESAVAQLAGALVVALLATVPVLVLPATAELDVVRLLLAGFMAAVGYVVARGAGAGRGRAAVYAAVILVVALVVAVLKNVLSGH